LTSNLIAEQLKQLPAGPGVYLMRDSEGRILYVGKAADLSQRVRSYFSGVSNLPLKIRRLVDRIHDIDYYVTNLEQEALILELNLIKQHHPLFNVRLKDDKSFPFLKISLHEEWPRVYFTRLVDEDGSRYFGPFASAKSVRQTIQALQRIFPFRSCAKPIRGADPRACLEYHMNRCVAPCTGEVTSEEYADIIQQVILFLEGKQDTVARHLQEQMSEAAEALSFEKAARIRDQLQAIDRVVEGQKIATTTSGEQDVIAFAPDKDQAYVQVFFVRNDRLIGRDSFVMEGTASEEPPDIMAGFIKQFYSSASYVPPLLLLQHPVEDQATIEEWLSGRRGRPVHIQVPRRGSKRRLVRIVAENAEQGLRQMRIKHLASTATLTEALEGLQRELQLPNTPSRLEGYDISNIQGTGAVGSMVVFDEGRPKPAHYRRFRIKAVDGANDYAMLQEVLRRRFRRRAGAEGAPATNAWAILPDLVLIDGGKGQLNAARAAMEELGAGSVPLASIAKENEEIFTPRSTDPLVLPGSSPSLQLLQRLRDEAHRFALGYHQKLRRRQTFDSTLDAVPGIGPKRKRALLRQFGSVRAIRDAPLEELAAAEGMSPVLARKVKEIL
jgi:excinuclease ABC subunit C